MTLLTSVQARPFLLISGSKLTGWAAMCCSIHCAVTPILVVLAPALALSENVERAMLFFTLILGALVIFMGPARHRLAVVGAFLGGVILWGTSHFGYLEPIPENATSATGALLLGGALFASARICRSGECEKCSTVDNEGNV